MKDKLRVGVIGAGRWSTGAHLPGWTRSPLTEVAVVCDLHQDLAEAAAEEFHIPEAVTDYQQVFSRGDIDVVDIVTRGALKRAADVDDMVGGALFFASPAAAFITGQTLIVDGGRQFI